MRRVAVGGSRARRLRARQSRLQLDPRRRGVDGVLGQAFDCGRVASTAHCPFEAGRPIREIHRRFRGTKSVYLEEFATDDLQLAILRAQSRLAPGHVITAVDIANEFGVGQLPAQQALDTLRKLHLVEVSFGTIDGFPGYLLTRPGRVFLLADGGSAGS